MSALKDAYFLGLGHSGVSATGNYYICGMRVSEQEFAARLALDARDANDHGDVVNHENYQGQKYPDYEAIVEYNTDLSALEAEAMAQVLNSERPGIIPVSKSTLVQPIAVENLELGERVQLIDPDALCVNAMHGMTEQAASELKAYVECPCCNADNDLDDDDTAWSASGHGSYLGLDPVIPQIVEDEVLPPFEYFVNGYKVSSGGYRRSDAGQGYVTITQLGSSVRIPLETWADIVYKWHQTRFES